MFTLTLFLDPNNCHCFYELLVFMYVFTKTSVSKDAWYLKLNTDIECLFLKAADVAGY